MTRAAAASLLALALLCATATLAAAPTSSSPPQADEVAALLEQAEAARARAASLDAEWLETQDLIRRARESAAAQDWGAALQLAGFAKQQGDLAVAQAERERTAWRRRVVQ